LRRAGRTQLKKELKSRIKTLLKALAVLTAAALIWGFTVEPSMLTVSEIEYADARLPKEMDGVRLVYVSDLHTGPYYRPDAIKRLTEKIDALNPDMLLFGGDMLQRPADIGEVDSVGVASAFATVHPRLGKYAIYGNHDIWTPEMKMLAGQILTDGGFTILENSAVEVVPGFYISGTAPWPMEGERAFGNYSDVGKVAYTTDNNTFSLLMAHEPAQVRNNSKYPFAVQLSGHTHGGQVEVPFTDHAFWIGNTEIFESGFFTMGKTTMYVSRGIGTSVIRLRLFVPPEIVVLTLHKK
jgi:uncharacterized protein